MPATATPEIAETLIFLGPDAIKSTASSATVATVGAYAIRFTGPDDKDAVGEYFTAKTNFGPRCGDGVATLFHHGHPFKGLEGFSETEFPPATTRRDDVGIYAETTLDLTDPDHALVAKLCGKGVLKWSSGSASHLVRRGPDGEIKRWHPIEFSFTPTPCDPQLPAIRPIKGIADTEPSAEFTAALKTEEPETRNPEPETPAPVDNTKSAVLTEPLAPTISLPTMTPEEIAAEKAANLAAQKAAVDSAVKAREVEIAEINDLAEQYHCADAAKSFIRDRKSAADFQTHILKEVLKAKPVDLNSGMVGMDQNEIRKYSFLKAIREMSSRNGLTGLEKECHTEALKKIGRDVDGKTFIVPEEVYRGSLKAQNATTATAGGFLVQNTYMAPIELLRNKTRVIEAGATQLGGLVGDVIIPVHVSGSTAYWVAETAALTDSQSVFGQKKLTPHRLGSTIPYSTQFIAQASVDAESFIRNDATKVLGIEIDRAALLGSGVNGEPLGVANTTGINATVTYSGAAAWADVVEHETGIADDNADFDEMAFILGVTTVGKWKTILKDSVAGAGYLIGDNMMANGYRVLRSKQVGSAAQSFFGAWSQLILASWSGLEVIVDPYALKKSGQVEVTFNELRDSLIRQPLAFNVSTDSAAQ